MEGRKGRKRKRGVRTFAGWIAIDLGVQTRRGRREKKAKEFARGRQGISSGALWVQPWIFAASECAHGPAKSSCLTGSCKWQVPARLAAFSHLQLPPRPPFFGPLAGSSFAKAGWGCCPAAEGLSLQRLNTSYLLLYEMPLRLPRYLEI